MTTIIIEDVIAEIASLHGITIDPIKDAKSAGKAADALEQSPRLFASGEASMAVEYASRAARQLSLGNLQEAFERAKLAIKASKEGK